MATASRNPSNSHDERLFPPFQVLERPAGERPQHETPTKFIPVAGRSWTSNQPDNINYWKYLSDLYQPEPVEERDRMMFAMLLPLGIEPGKPFKPDARQSKNPD